MRESLRFECKVESKSPILRQLTVSVKPESFQGYIDSSFADLQKNASLKGFRKGKVPVSLLKQRYMSDVKADVVKQVVSDSFWKAVEDEKIMPVGSPNISELKGIELEGKELTYKAEIEVFPDVKIADLKKLKAKKFTATVTDADIEKAFENLRNSHGEMQSSEGDASFDRPTKDGDYIDITFKGTVDGQTHEKLQAEHHIAQIGAKRFMEEFEAALVGMKKGETRHVTVKFPTDFPDDLVAGKNVEFDITLNEIKKMVLPELDDEFAKRFKFEDLKELRSRIESSLKEEREADAKTKTRESLMTALLEAHSFDVPSALVDAEVKAMERDVTSQLKRQGFTDKMVQSELDRSSAEVRSRATDRVRAFLILDRVAEEQKLNATDADLDKEFEEMSKTMGASAEQVKAMYLQSEDALRRLRHRIKEDRVIEYLLGQVKIENVA